MLGASGYARTPLDFYPTPRPAFDALIEALGDDFAPFFAWEPFAGNGAIATPLKPFVQEVLATDIHRYEGFEVDAVEDFFKLTPADLDRLGALKVRPETVVDEKGEERKSTPLPPRPDAIITNPPYGKDAERAARHALDLMEADQGLVAFLCRHEWDAARSRADLFDHPAFTAKVTLRHRPRWIAGTKGAPRFAYAWYVWDWSKPVSAKPELLYAG
ncbi:hypothetical protein Ccr5_gp124c [Caulobacter phage Ccr5]|nr:hypothetical protein Ccr5_gp124c [Caulobacter phage Ccr5]